MTAHEPRASPTVMSTVSRIVQFGAEGRAVSDDTWNPLREEDQLQEAILIAVSMEAIPSTVAVLFDLAHALQLREGTAALLVLRGAHVAKWQSEPAPHAYPSYHVLSSVPVARGGWLEMTISTFPDAELVVAGTSAEFYELDVTSVASPYAAVDLEHTRSAAWVRPDWADDCVIRNYWST